MLRPKRSVSTISAKTRKGKTTILIAHRITTIESIDNIIFIDDGNVIDVGTHIELYNRCKDYKNMVELQRITALEADI